MDPRMLELIAEHATTVRERLPAGRDWGNFVWDPTEWDELLASDAKAARAWGWLEGAADAEDLTVVELLDEAAVLPTAD